LSRYYISEELKKRVISAAKNRCGYCLVPQDLIPIRLTIEHIVPRSAGGSSEEDNLWLSCPTCNNYFIPLISFDQTFLSKRKVWLQGKPN